MIDTRAILLTYATRYGSTQEVAEVITVEGNSRSIPG